MYADSREHLLDELARVDLMLRQYLESWWGGRDHADGTVPGLFVSDEEIDGLIQDPRGAEWQIPSDANRAQERGVVAEYLERLTAEIRDRARASAQEGIELRLPTLANEFELSTLERDVLVLVLAPDIDPTYEKVFGYLRDDITKARPTVDLLTRVLARTENEGLAMRQVFSEQSTLRRERLLRLDPGPTVPSSELRVADRVLTYLLGGDEVADSIADIVSVHEHPGSESVDAPDDRHQQAIEHVANRLRQWKQTAEDGHSSNTRRDSEVDERPVFGIFDGDDQRAADLAVESACSTAGIPYIYVDGRRLPMTGLPESLAVIRREARLRQAAILLNAPSAIDTHQPRTGQPPGSPEEQSERRTPTRDALLDGLDAFPGPVFLTGETDIAPTVQSALEHHAVYHCTFDRPEYRSRRRLWRSIGNVSDDTAADRLASTFSLTRGEIEDAVDTAKALSQEGLTIDAIEHACRMHSGGELDALGRRVEPTYDWDDIVLPADTLDHLRELAGAIRHRGTVFEEWGFATRFSLGNGINALFTGKSGTGKTMAAEIIASEVGLPMYKIDLSNVLSKYIGETEENLGRVFDAAERSNAMLFFDEADALFGKRTEISDSRDRYANVEVDYLLQRMEEHDGCAILASNLKENIDEAFRRRIHTSIEFPMPDEAAREDIWRLIFPPETPTAELDFAFLATFELSGGHIKNAAVTAAGLAADDGQPVAMEHLVVAIRREFQKTGKLYDRGALEGQLEGGT